MRETMLERIIDGRTDSVFEYLAEGHAANATDDNGVSLIKWCASGNSATTALLFIQGGTRPLTMASAGVRWKPLSLEHRMSSNSVEPPQQPVPGTATRRRWTGALGRHRNQAWKDDRIST